MFDKPSCTVLACALLLAACTQTPPRPGQAEAPPPLRAEVTEAGLAAYQQVCAECQGQRRRRG